MTWRDEIKKCIRTEEQLKKYVNLSHKEEKQLQKVIEKNPMKIPRYYASLINWNDPDDPIKQMAVPSTDELDLSGSYDTSGEKINTKMPGLQHKYSQTALILLTNRCNMYCRHCFRKRLIGLSRDEILQKIDSAVFYIQNHKEITNVLISGGDPFTLSTTIIEKLLKKLVQIDHLSFIRFGTRIPVTFPQRLLEDKELLNLLKKYSTKNKRIYVVTQFNHPNEITEKSIDAVAKLINSGIILNNQTVLLKKVNNNPDTLAELQNGLISIGVNPYYVFQCRPVKRIKNRFQTTLYNGYNVVEETKKMLNGHSKRFRYVMSHKTGKIEIAGMTDNYIYFKYHQAKNPSNSGKFFKKKLNKKERWLDELN